jgi:mycobactin peptide synthetase MbtE
MYPGGPWSNEQPYLRGELVHELFSEVARRSPSTTAVIHGDQRISYGELEARADQFATRLAAAGVGPGHLVPVVLPRSVPLVVAFLAILKSGAAYGALDGRWPTARLAGLVRTLGAPVVVTDIAADLPSPKLAPPDLSTPVAANDGRRGERLPGVTVHGDDPAAIFFTSGSTGQPKAALSPHRGTVRLFQDCTFATFDEATVMPLTAAVPWDALTLELWGVLLNGGCSVVVDEPFLLPAKLRQIVDRHHVNMVSFTSSLFNMFVDEDLEAFAALDQVFVGGERVSAPHVARLLSRYPELAVQHCYGPVESTLFASTHRVTLADCDHPDGIPLGVPVPNTGLYVWDGGGPCAPGQVGELLITGDGLASGYLDAAEQTLKQFPTLWLDDREQRAYRTGDLVHWSEQGTLHFDGRMDRQVKIRGHRIEPAEIERAAAAGVGVSECVAVPVPDDRGGFSGIVLAYTTRSSDPPPEGDVLSQLRLRLPEYLVPDAAVFLAEWPLNDNGKLDTGAVLRAFADRRTEQGGSGGAGPAGDSLLETVAETMAAVLGRSGLPYDVDFFSLGGTSLQLGAVCTRLGATLGVAVPISEAVRRLNARELASWLRDATAQSDCTSDPEADDQGFAVLTGMQESFWMRQAAEPDDISGLCPLSWVIDGPVNERALTAALGDVHRRHEALRSCYGIDERFDEDRPVAVPLSATDATVQFRRLVAATEQYASELLHEALLQPFDIEVGEVWRAALVRVGEEGGWLFGVAVHHVAFDGWSEHILVNDLSTAYAARLAGTAPAFGSTPRSVAEVAGLVERATLGRDLPAQRDYWRELLTNVPELRIPPASADADGSPGTSRRRATRRPGNRRFRLDPADLAVVDQLAQENAVTPFTVLLGACGAALRAVTGQADFGLGVPISRRDGKMLTETIGCLIDAVCLRVRPVSGGWRPLIESARDSLRDALAMQEIPFTEVVRLVKPQRTSRDPLYQAMLVYQDNPRAILNLSGCRTGVYRLTPAHATSEIVIELWPQQEGSLAVDVTFQRDLVPDRVAADFMEALTTIVRHGPASVDRTEPLSAPANVSR